MTSFIYTLFWATLSSISTFFINKTPTPQFTNNNEKLNNIIVDAKQQHLFPNNIILLQKGKHESRSGHTLATQVTVCTYYTADLDTHAQI